MQTKNLIEPILASSGRDLDKLVQSNFDEFDMRANQYLFQSTTGRTPTANEITTASLQPSTPSGNNKVLNYLECENERLHHELIEKSRKLALLAEQHSILKSDYAQAESSIEECLQQLGQLSKTDKDQAERMRILKDSIKRKDTKLQSMQELLQLHRDKVQMAEVEMESLREQQRQLTDTMQRREQEFVQTIERKDSELSRLNEELQTNNRQIKTLKEDLESQLAKYQSREQGLQARIAVLQKHCKSIDSQLMYTKSKHHQVKLELERKSVELNCALVDRNSLSEQLAQIRRELVDSSNINREIFDKNKLLESEVIEMNELRANYKSLETEFKALQQNASSLVQTPPQTRKFSETDSKEVQVNIDAVKMEMMKHQFNEQKQLMNNLQLVHKQTLKELQSLRNSQSENSNDLQERRFSGMKQQMEIMQSKLDEFTAREKKLLQDCVDKEAQVLLLNRELNNLKMQTMSTTKSNQRNNSTYEEAASISKLLQSPSYNNGDENETLAKLDKRIGQLQQGMESDQTLTAVIKEALSPRQAPPSSLSFTHETNELFGNGDSVIAMADNDNEISAMNLDLRLCKRINQFHQKN